VENCGNLFGDDGHAPVALVACSACTGDYQDPDRTAWRDENFVEEDSVEEASDANEKLEEE
jgi:hypothetical protein